MGNRTGRSLYIGVNKMKKKRVEKYLIGALASCHDCDWEEEDYRTAQKDAREHARKTGHTVNVETTYTQTYNQRKD